MAVVLPPDDAPRRPPSSGALRRFLFDLAVATAMVLGLSVAGMAAWMVVKAVAAAAGMAHPEVDAVAGAIGQPGALAQMAVALFSTGGAALLLYFWRRPAGAGERQASWRALARASTWGWIVLAVAAVIVAGQLGSRLGDWLGVEAEPTNEAMVQDGMAGFPWAMAVFAVLLAPMYEELLFRRVLFGRLWQAGRPWLGLALTSIAFALLHELPGTQGWRESLPLWFVYGFMGMAFAGTYWRTGSLWAAIVAHALNNAIALFALS